MSSVDASASLLAIVRPVYPERAEPAPDGWLDEIGDRLGGGLVRWWKSRRALKTDFVAVVRAAEEELRATVVGDLQERARDLGKLLRRDGFEPGLVARAFALISRAAELTKKMRPFDVQLMGGYVLLRGMVAEMETGEGKTLTATLPACTAALAGVPVHVITVNDYLVTRDAALMKPVYDALGLTVGVVTEEQQPPERQAAYACNVTYGTNKTIVFDYLRDRIALGSRNSPMRLQLEKLAGGNSRVNKLLLRGLSFAIVDEADSVLVDEARTPLIISAPSGSGDEERVALQGIELAKQLVEDEDFLLDIGERKIVLTDTGQRRLERLCADLGGVWAGLLRREELASQALSALHLFTRDEHYLVREGKIQIIDEYTGRIMADRSWERGLHQLVEAKEGCKITAQKEPLARISYQRFFRRYLLLAGMTGTAEEVRSELGYVYGLTAVRIPTNRPSRRAKIPEQVFGTEDQKWEAIARRVREVNETGRPVLLGTRSVAASERASTLLKQLGLDHRVLNAKQDQEEADIVAAAGERGRITIATNMAGRGTDIKLAPDVSQIGGLHVILSERHDSERIDRQLAGRCARQGDPGVFEPMLSIDDAIMDGMSPMLRGALVKSMAGLSKDKAAKLGSFAIKMAQRSAERAHSRIRKVLLKMDQQTGKLLAFSGRNE
jgi:preprotein translocase subunit SecA